MFDFAWSELLVIGVVALIVIKPKDLPKVLRTVGYWVRQARQVASEFQSSIEQMAREAELSDVKKEIEDAGRKLTAEVHQTFDPGEIEKKFYQPDPAPPTPSSIDSATIDPSIEASALEPPAIPPVTDEPTLPFAELAAPPTSAPAALPSAAATEPAASTELEPVAAKPGTHDRA
jgi:sec-independent protein translocase protein TatB